MEQLRLEKLEIESMLPALLTKLIEIHGSVESSVEERDVYEESLKCIEDEYGAALKGIYEGVGGEFELELTQRGYSENDDDDDDEDDDAGEGGVAGDKGEGEEGEEEEEEEEEEDGMEQYEELERNLSML